jgi:glycosyltransferase involved in cell wall biosynthesis
MMSNVVPVASRTGFSEDVVRHGDNGFLFPVDAPVSEICALIEKAFALDADVRSDALELSWRNYSLAIQKLLGYPQKHDRNASSSSESGTNSRLVVSV